MGVCVPVGPQDEFPLLDPEELAVSDVRWRGTEERELKVIGLDESPALSPDAARALLRLMINVARTRGVAVRMDDGEERKAA
jgi:hypothetical protein